MYCSMLKTLFLMLTILYTVTFSTKLTLKHTIASQLLWPAVFYFIYLFIFKSSPSRIGPYNLGLLTSFKTKEEHHMFQVK